MWRKEAYHDDYTKSPILPDDRDDITEYVELLAMLHSPRESCRGVHLAKNSIYCGWIIRFMCVRAFARCLEGLFVFLEVYFATFDVELLEGDARREPFRNSLSKGRLETFNSPRRKNGRSIRTNKASLPAERAGQLLLPVPEGVELRRVYVRGRSLRHRWLFCLCDFCYFSRSRAPAKSKQ